MPQAGADSCRLPRQAAVVGPAGQRSGARGRERWARGPLLFPTGEAAFPVEQGDGLECPGALAQQSRWRWEAREGVPVSVEPPLSRCEERRARAAVVPGLLLLGQGRLHVERLRQAPEPLCPEESSRAAAAAGRERGSVAHLGQVLGKAVVLALPSEGVAGAGAGVGCVGSHQPGQGVGARAWKGKGQRACERPARRGAAPGWGRSSLPSLLRGAGRVPCSSSRCCRSLPPSPARAGSCEPEPPAVLWGGRGGCWGPSGRWSGAPCLLPCGLSPGPVGKAVQQMCPGGQAGCKRVPFPACLPLPGGWSVLLALCRKAMDCTGGHL